jgi:aminoglycoside phosphotransferase (APT) family kinase protein
MPLPRRDLALTHRQLVPWLAKQLPAASELRVSDFDGSGTTGFSNDTLLFEASWKEAGRAHHERLVLRIEPSGMRVFPAYDLGLQFRILARLEATAVPVPRPLWLEPDPEVLGAPFYVMERVEGRVPEDSPTYHMQGWLTETAPEERCAIWWSGVETLAEIHRLDPLDLALLPAPEAPQSPLDAQLAAWRQYLTWVSGGDAGRYPLSEAALAWLERHRPAGPEPVGLCWGDARMGNMIFRDGRCVAVLDWEMAALGNPEQDLAWWLFFDEHHSAGVGAERLAGFPSREQTIARWGAITGIEPQHLDYYDLFACFRFSAVMARVGQQFREYGLMPAEADLDRNNTCTRMLEARLARLGG